MTRQQDDFEEDSHHLQVVDISITFPAFDAEYEHLIPPREIVSNEPSHLHLDIKNIGNSKFPGGTIGDVTIRHGSGFHSIATYSLDNYDSKIDEIKAGETIEDAAEVHLSTAFSKESIMVKIGITASDGNDVLMHFGEDDEGEEVYQRGIAVVDREQLKIINRLDRILSEEGGES